MALFWEKYLSKMQVLLEVFKYKYKYRIYTGKFWPTIQVKAIGEEKFVNKLQSVHMPNTFPVYLNIGSKNFGK